MLYTKPDRYECAECGGIASYPNPHAPDCIYRGAGQFAMSPMVSTIRIEMPITEYLAARAEGEEWPNLCTVLLNYIAALLTGIDQAAQGRVPA